MGEACNENRHAASVCYNPSDMEDRTTVFWKSLRPFLGNVVGVGIFALPFTMAHAGFGVGVGAVLLCAAASAVAYLMYADIALHTSGHARFVGLMRQYVGPFGGVFAALAFFVSAVGTLTAYILVGGSFAHVVFAPLVGGGVFVYRMAFLFFSAIAMFGGLLTVMRLQKYIIAAYVVLVGLMIALALPHVDVARLVVSTGSGVFLPLGVALFAFNGFGAVPEMRDILGRHASLLPRALLTGVALVTFLYVAFAAIVVGVSGAGTSQEALYGMAQVLGPVMLMVGSAIGLCTVGSAFMTHGVVVINTLTYDYRVRYLSAWAFAVMVPCAFVLMGSTNFVRVIEVTGGIGGGLVGLVLVAAYEKMRLHPGTAKNFLAIPQWAVFLTSVFFFASMVMVLARAS